jgi:hypothetical protein
MPIQIQNNTFTDSFGNSSQQYISNAGDQLTASFTLRSIIRISSANNPLTLDVSLNVVTSPTIGWLDEGFRVGDWCLFTRYASNGTIIQQWFSNIVYLDNQNADFTAMPTFYDITQNEVLEIYALDYFGQPSAPPGGFTTARPRSDMSVLINHSLSGQQGNSLSLIDGENSRSLLTGVESLGVGLTLNGVFVGNQSGQFFQSCELTRNSNTSDGWNNYTLNVEFANSGMYDSEWFDTVSNLKYFMKILSKSLPNDGFDETVVTYDQEANTGWFNQPHEISLNNSTLIQGTSEIDYCNTTSHQIIVDGPTTEIGIGACYVSTNVDYYKNKSYNQYGITMLVPTSDVSSLPTLVSPLNVDGAGFTIEITNVATVGSETTIDFDFIPNAAFDTFMDGLNDGDRLLYLWVKCGNINHLAFSDQLSCEPVPAGPLVMIDDFGFLDHAENFVSINDESTGFEANTEDDIAYYGTFLLNKYEVIENFQVRIEAFNTLTGDDFTLLETNFSFGGLQIASDGRYNLNESLNIVNTLPTNSVKRNALFQLFPAYDTTTQYGVSIYYPFLLRWEYWLEQLNANPDFWPNQNKNWEQYDNSGAWQLRLKLTLNRGGLGYIHTNSFLDKPYNSDANITQTIELFIDATNQNVGVVTEGELMRVVATHELTNGDVWIPSKTWGMITVEPKESSPRSICSSVLPFDNNTLNPLQPLDGVQMVITFPTTTTARMECFFNPDLINLENGVKFTTKIKQDCSMITPKTTTDGTIKTTTFGTNKIIS